MPSRVKMIPTLPLSWFKPHLQRLTAGFLWHRFYQRTCIVLLAFCALITLAGCTTIAPMNDSAQLQLTSQTFSHADLDRVLQRFVDEQGRVDYAALQDAAADLERYYLLIATYSPDSHPELFSTDQSRMAYWINAYNAAVIKAVLTHYPIASVLDVKPPRLFFFLPEQSGFFLFQRMIFGGSAMSLYYLENMVIRKRFVEPRIHFALNCASQSCPRLPKRAFTAEHLDEELEREARKFIGEARNFRIDHEQQAIFLSEIFKWYERDFTEWYQDRFPHREATLLAYVALYLPPEQAARMETHASDYEIRFTPYNWRLNDQNALDN